MQITTVQTLSDTKLSKVFFYGLSCAYVVLLLLCVALSQAKGAAIVGVLLALYFARHWERVLNHPKYHPIAVVSPLAEIVILFVLFLQSGTGIETIVFVLFAADIILHYKSWYAFPFAYGGFVTYLVLWPKDGSDLWQHAFDLLSYSCLVIPIWSTKLLLNQRDMNFRLNEALLQEAKMREEMAALKERTRIAEEVHDTVGHNLTTAIVALEGAGLLFDQRPEEARQKIRVAREQLKQGLGNIRQVVKTLKATDGIAGGLGLEQGIRTLIIDTEKQTGVRFHLGYEVKSALISLQEYVMINVVKESITNTLKHGRASVIEIVVVERQETIHMNVKDNGQGSASIVYGFGLKSMEGKIEAVGGQFSVQSEPGKGFELYIRMPIAKGDG